MQLEALSRVLIPDGRELHRAVNLLRADWLIVFLIVISELIIFEAVERVHPSFPELWITRLEEDSEFLRACDQTLLHAWDRDAINQAIERFAQAGTIRCGQHVIGVEPVVGSAVEQKFEERINVDRVSRHRRDDDRRRFRSFPYRTSVTDSAVDRRQIDDLPANRKPDRHPRAGFLNKPKPGVIRRP